MHDLSSRRSAALTALAVGLHLGGLLGLSMVLPARVWPVAVLLCGLALWRALSPKSGDVCRAQGQVDGEWTLTFRDGRREAGWRLDVQRSLCHPWLVILALHRGPRTIYQPLAADAVNADALRRLRVSLRAG